jgi:hypothetical protein
MKSFGPIVKIIDAESPIEQFFEGEDLVTHYNASYRPKCVNEGCNRLAHHVNRNSRGEIRYRPTCSDCHSANMEQMPYHADVVEVRRKGVCENEGQYGFKCITKGYLYETALHHKDHDPRNNDPDNIDELCFPCHEQHHAITGKGVKRTWEG